MRLKSIFAFNLPPSDMVLTGGLVGFTDNRSFVTKMYGWKDSKNKVHEQGTKTTLSFWNITTKQLRRKTVLHSVIATQTLSPDGKVLGAISSMKTISLFDTSSGRLKHTFSPHAYQAYGLAFSPDNETLAVGSSLNGLIKGQAVLLLNAATGQEKKQLRGFVWGTVGDLAFSPDGSLLAAISFSDEANSGELAVWNVHTGKRICWLTGLDSRVNESNEIRPPLFFLSGNKRLVCGERMLNIDAKHKSLKPLLKVSGRQCLALYPQGKNLVLFASTRDHNLELWDVTLRRRLQSWRGLPQSWEEEEFRVSPNGQVAVTMDDTYAVKFWRLSAN